MNKLFFILLCAFGILGCATSDVRNAAQISKIEIKSFASIGQNQSGQNIQMGGLSSLVLLAPADSSKKFSFISITDRGPNGASEKSGVTRVHNVRPFLLPKFNPQIIYFDFDKKTNKAHVVKSLALRAPNGELLTGLPPKSQVQLKNVEGGVTESGQPIADDLLGIDPEGLAVDEDGGLWVCEEYRPALMHFSSEGQLLQLFVPESYYSHKDLKKIELKYGSHKFISQVLPKKMMKRQLNRGFEGVLINGENIVLMTQSPLENEVLGGKAVRWIVINKNTMGVEEVVYNLQDENVDKLGDISISGGHIYVIEQNSKTNEKANRKLFRVDLVRQNNHWELISKQMFLDLTDYGLREFEKLEGIAVVSDQELYLINDNDFGLDYADGNMRMNPNKKSYLFKYQGL